MASRNSPSQSSFIALRGGGNLLALYAAVSERPRCLYCGPDLPGASPQELAQLSTQQHAPGGPQSPIMPSLLNTLGTGFASPAGLIAHRRGQDWAIDLRVAAVEMETAQTAVLLCEDAVSGVAARHSFALHPDSGVLTCKTAIENRSDQTLALEWCAALSLPIDPQLSRFMSFSGRWAGEFAVEEFSTSTGSFVKENRRGRTGHDAFPGLIAKTPEASEQFGLAAGFHLAWSGNSRLRLDHGTDGSGFVQMGELFLPGEIELRKGETYQSPGFLAAYSNAGLSGVSEAFHRHLRSAVLDRRTADKMRPVHFNTWEALYFDHDEAALFDLAQRAADVGAERFILDDGWFGARRSDAAGLGDWHVARDIYPNGLTPLADHVRSLGMEFGLWFEPEMVNADSDLYRAHPDWILRVDGAEPIPSRHQLPLDLTRQEVSDYLFERIRALVGELSLGYIKWDMNRDVQHPGGSDGRPAAHRQTLALYALIERLRSAHPALEIESCASGGGRADFGILRRCDRIWTSDNNDARSRHAIMRGASHFFPLSVLGNHVGPCLLYTSDAADE